MTDSPTEPNTPNSGRPEVVPTSSPSQGRPQKSTSSLVPHPKGDDVELESTDEPVENPSSSLQNGTTWNPNHPSVRAAWIHVHASIQTRQLDGLWSSTTLVTSIARGHLPSHARAEDFIRSLIKHGYLEERPYPGFTKAHHHSTQIRLKDGGL